MQKLLAPMLRALTAVALLLAPPPADAQKGPIKIGMIVPQSGPLAPTART